MEPSQDFGDNDGGGHGVDERRADGLAGEQRHAATIECAFLKQLAIGRRVGWAVGGIAGSPLAQRS